MALERASSTAALLAAIPPSLLALKLSSLCICFLSSLTLGKASIFGFCLATSSSALGGASTSASGVSSFSVFSSRRLFSFCCSASILSLRAAIYLAFDFSSYRRAIALALERASSVAALLAAILPSLFALELSSLSICILSSPTSGKTSICGFCLEATSSSAFGGASSSASGFVSSSAFSSPGMCSGLLATCLVSGIF